PQLERASTSCQPPTRRWAAATGRGGPLQPRSSCGRAPTAHGVRGARRDCVLSSATDGEGWANPYATGSHRDGRHRTAAPEWRRLHLERGEHLLVGRTAFRRRHVRCRGLVDELARTSRQYPRTAFPPGRLRHRHRRRKDVHLGRLYGLVFQAAAWPSTRSPRLFRRARTAGSQRCVPDSSRRIRSASWLLKALRYGRSEMSTSEV